MNFDFPHFGMGDLEIVKEIARKPDQAEPTRHVDNVKRIVNFVAGVAQRHPAPLEPVETVTVASDEVPKAKKTGTHRKIVIG